jgi:hypothetical protein
MTARLGVPAVCREKNMTTGNETTLLRRIMVAVSKRGARVFRNNVGVALHPRGFRVVYGLCPGSSDLIGWYSRTIQPEDVGQLVAVFVALEVKSPRGRVTQVQQTFLDAVHNAGGIARVVRSVEDAEEAISEPIVQRQPVLKSGPREVRQPTCRSGPSVARQPETGSGPIVARQPLSQSGPASAR